MVTVLASGLTSARRNNTQQDSGAVNSAGAVKEQSRFSENDTSTSTGAPSEVKFVNDTVCGLPVMGKATPFTVKFPVSGAFSYVTCNTWVYVLESGLHGV